MQIETETKMTGRGIAIAERVNLSVLGEVTIVGTTTSEGEDHTEIGTGSESLAAAAAAAGAGTAIAEKGVDNKTVAETVRRRSQAEAAVGVATKTGVGEIETRATVGTDEIGRGQRDTIEGAETVAMTGTARRIPDAAENEAVTTATATAAATKGAGADATARAAREIGGTVPAPNDVRKKSATNDAGSSRTSASAS